MAQIDDRLDNFGFIPLGAAQAFTSLLNSVDDGSQAEDIAIGIAAFFDAHYAYITAGITAP